MTSQVSNPPIWKYPPLKPFDLKAISKEISTRVIQKMISRVHSKVVNATQCGGRTLSVGNVHFRKMF